MQPSQFYKLHAFECLTHASDTSEHINMLRNIIHYSTRKHYVLRLQVNLVFQVRFVKGRLSQSATSLLIVLEYLDITNPSFVVLQDCFGRPIASAPDSWFDVVQRTSNDNNKTLQ